MVRSLSLAAALSLAACATAPERCERSAAALPGTLLVAEHATLAVAPPCVQQWIAVTHRWRLDCRAPGVTLVVWVAGDAAPLDAPDGTALVVDELTAHVGSTGVQGPAYGSTLTRRGNQFVLDALACEHSAAPIRANGFVLDVSP